MNRDVLAPFVDKDGLIGKRQRDGSLEFGDCHANQYTVLYCEKAILGYPLQDAIRVDKLLTHENGIPIRHPDPEKWYSHADRVSRDQLYSRIFFWGLYGSNIFLFLLFWQHAKRGFLFAWNTRKNGSTEQNHDTEYAPGKFRDYGWKLPDFTGPEVWAAWIRAFRVWPLWPLLIIFDLENLLSSVVKLLQWSIGKSDPDIRNHILSTDFNNRIMPTPWSRLSLLIFSRGKQLALARHWWSRPGEPPLDRWVEKLLE